VQRTNKVIDSLVLALTMTCRNRLRNPFAIKNKWPVWGLKGLPKIPTVDADRCTSDSLIRRTSTGWNNKSRNILKSHRLKVKKRPRLNWQMVLAKRCRQIKKGLIDWAPMKVPSTIYTSIDENSTFYYSTGILLSECNQYSVSRLGKYLIICLIKFPNDMTTVLL